MVWAPDDPTPPWLQQLPSDPFAQAPVETQYAPDGTPPDAPPSPPVAAPEVAAPPASPAVIASGAAAPAPDAISGAAEGIGAHAQYLNNIGPVHFDPYGQSPEQDAQQRSTDLIAMAPEDRADTIATGDPSKLASAASASMTPEELAAINIRHEQAAMHQQAADALDMSRRNQVEAEQNYKAYVAAQQKAAADTAQVQADAQRIAGTKISATPGIGLALAGVISSALVGGLQRSGTPNGALQSFQKAIDDHIQEQKDNLANQWQGVNARKSAITDELAQHGDLFRAQETFRIAAYDRALGDLKTKAQDYDPQGTTALRIAQTTQQFQAARAQALEAVNAARQKQQLELFEAQRKQAADAETVKHNRQAEALQGYGISSENTRAAENRKVERERLAAETVKTSMTAADKAATQQAEQEQKFSVPGLTTKDGKPFVAVGTDTGVEKLRMSIAATKEVVGITDEIRRVRSGFTSKIGNSDENQRLASLTEQLNIALKNAHDLGAITPTDEKLIEGARGFDDATKWRSIEAGIKQARANIIRKTNLEVQAHKRPGTEIEFDIPDLQGKKPEETEQERKLHEVLEEAQGNTSYTPDDEKRADITAGEQAWRAAGGTPDNPAPGGKELGDFIIPKRGRDVVQALAADVTSDDPNKRAFAIDALTQMSQKVPNSGLRHLAESELAAALSPTSGNGEGATSDFEGRSAGAHETLPPVRATPNPRGTMR